MVQFVLRCSVVVLTVIFIFSGCTNDEEKKISHFKRGQAYYKRGLYDYAVSELTAAAEKLSDNAIVCYYLGMAYLKKGNSERARRELEKALSLGSSFNGAEEARKALADLK